MNLLSVVGLPETSSANNPVNLGGPLLTWLAVHLVIVLAQAVREREREREIFDLYIETLKFAKTSGVNTSGAPRLFILEKYSIHMYIHDIHHIL